MLTPRDQKEAAADGRGPFAGLCGRGSGGCYGGGVGAASRYALRGLLAPRSAAGSR